MVHVLKILKETLKITKNETIKTTGNVMKTRPTCARRRPQASRGHGDPVPGLPGRSPERQRGATEERVRVPPGVGALGRRGGEAWDLLAAAFL